MRLEVVTALFLLVGSSMEQSGDSTDDEDEDHKPEVKMNFTCFSKIRIGDSKLICNITERPSENTKEIFFIYCLNGKCEKKTEFQSYENIQTVTTFNVCMIWGDNKMCRNYNLQQIVIPDRPSNISFTYDIESQQYNFNIEEPYEVEGFADYLLGKLIHEVVMRKKGGEWPDCEKQVTGGPYKMCFQNADIRIPKRNLESGAQYEVRARSKPDGYFFKGFWSPWTEVVSFSTEEDIQESDLFLVIVFFLVALAMLLITIIFIKHFWKSRIKPVIWPEIPDHKLALDRLRVKPKQLIQLSFNPDYFDSMAINKVDYIRALVRAEDSFQVSAAETCLEKNTTCSNIISPAVGSKEWSTNGSDVGQWNNPSDHADVDGKNGDNSEEIPTNPENVSPLLPSECNQKCRISKGGLVTPGVGILENFPIYSNELKQPNDVFNVYISMSAFKTPPTAVTQSFNK